MAWTDWCIPLHPLKEALGVHGPRMANSLQDGIKSLVVILEPGDYDPDQIELALSHCKHDDILRPLNLYDIGQAATKHA